MARHFTAGPGRAILFSQQTNNILLVGDTYTTSGIEFSLESAEVRGGQANGLFGKYFYNSNVSINLTDCMVYADYFSMQFGGNIEQGGPSLKEEELVVGVGGNSVTLSETAIAFDNAQVGRYRKVNEDTWSVGNITGGTTMSIPGAAQNDHYCVKYYYQNANARSVVIPVNQIPKEVHLLLIYELFSGDPQDISSATKYGRLLVDIPRYQTNGTFTLSGSATEATTVDINGNALALRASESCEDDNIYGTITEEVFGAKWQDSVSYLAIANSEIELAASATETLEVWAVYNNGSASNRVDNAALTFAVEDSPAATATGVQVAATTGVVTAGTTPGVAVIGVTLTDYANVPPAYATVTVTG